MLTRCTERLLGYIKLIPHWRVYKICLYRELYLWQQDIITLITNLCRLFWYLQSQLIPHPQVITHPNMGQRDAEGDWVTAVSLLLWSLRSCPLGGFLHLGSVLFVGVTGRFPHTASLWQEHGSSCFPSEAARGSSYEYSMDRKLFFLPSWCVWSSTALINQFWGLKWDIVFSILCSVFGKGWRKYSHSSLFCLSWFCFLLFVSKHKTKWFANTINFKTKKWFIFPPHTSVSEDK